MWYSPSAITRELTGGAKMFTCPKCTDPLMCMMEVSGNILGLCMTCASRHTISWHGDEFVDMSKDEFKSLQVVYKR